MRPPTATSLSPLLENLTGFSFLHRQRKNKRSDHQDCGNNKKRTLITEVRQKEPRQDRTGGVAYVKDTPKRPHRSAIVLFFAEFCYHGGGRRGHKGLANAENRGQKHEKIKIMRQWNTSKRDCAYPHPKKDYRLS